MKSRCLVFARFPILSGVANGEHEAADSPREARALRFFLPRNLPRSALARDASRYGEIQDSLRLPQFTYNETPKIHLKGSCQPPVPLENSERSEPKGIILLCQSCLFSFDAYFSGRASYIGIAH